MSTFVTVGNGTQPFNRLLDKVAELCLSLPQPVTVQHGSTPFSSVHCIPERFIGMEEFDRNVRKADLLIMHGGAGAIIHALQAGKRPVVMPRQSSYGEIIDDHQLGFVRALAAQGLVLLAVNPSELQERVAQAAENQFNEKRRESLGTLRSEVAGILSAMGNRTE